MLKMRMVFALLFVLISVSPTYPVYGENIFIEDKERNGALLERWFVPYCAAYDLRYDRIYGNPCTGEASETVYEREGLYSLDDAQKNVKSGDKGDIVKKHHTQK